MTNEMIEKSARAIYIETALGGDEAANAAHLSVIFGDARRPDYAMSGDCCRAAARAVLKELMTPTDEMVEAGALADDDCHVGTPYGPGRKFNAPELIWKAMLTQALNEGDGK